MSLKDKILKLGRSGDVEKLENLVQNQNCEDLVSMVRSSLRRSDGPAVLTYTLQACATKQETEKTRLKLIESSLEEVITLSSRIMSSDAKTYVEQLQNGVRNLTVESLPAIIDFLLRKVESVSENTGDEEGEVGWISIISAPLDEIKHIDNITPVDHHIEISGSEFRQRIIATLCEARWGPRMSIAMCQMFQDAKLSEKETEEVFPKFLTVLNRTTISDLPPFFHQVLQLVRDNVKCSARLMVSITQYFNNKLTLAERSEDNCNTMESSDLIQSDHSSEEVQQAEGVIVYYITQAAKMGHPIAKEISKLVKSSTNFPAMILNPFCLFSCLALTSSQQLCTTLLDCLKTAISKGFSIEESRVASQWFRQNTPPIPDISGLFSLVISQSKRYGGWDLIGQGLVDLSILMLDTQPPLGKINNKTRSLYNLASAILAKVIKKHPSSAQIIITKLQDRIIVNSCSSQYSTALRVIVKEATTHLMEDNNTAYIINFINNIHRMSYTAGRASLNGLMPLLKLNRTLRNPLILVLRKALFSKNLHTRQVGVSGVFTILKTFKISSNMVSSQSMSQTSGSLSQLSSDITRGQGATNEVLCTELLGVLHRCFSLQPKIQIIMYEGMFEVVAKNCELVEGCCELLHTHMLELFDSQAHASDYTKAALDLSDVIAEKHGQWVIVEPVGWFLHCIQTLVTKGQQMYKNGESQVVDKLASFLDNVVKYYSQAEPADLGFDPSDNFDRKTVDGRKRSLKVDVLITMYEALMEYTITHGANTKEKEADTLLELCHKYISLKNLMDSNKQPKKPAKKSDKVKKEKEGVEDGSEKKGDAVANKDKDKDKAVKRSADGKKHGDDYNMEMSTVMSLRCTDKLLKCLLEDRIPHHQTALNKLRNDPSFFGFIENTLNAQIERYSAILQQTGDEGVHSDGLFKALVGVISTLFRHSVTCLEPVEDFLQPGSQLLKNFLKMVMTYFGERKLEVACGLASLNVREQSHSNLNTLLNKSLEKLMLKMCVMRTQVDKDDSVATILTNLISVYTALLDLLHKDQELDGPTEAVKSFYNEFSCDDVSVCKAVAIMVFHCSLRLKHNSSICIISARQLHYIFGDLDTSREVEASKNLGYLSQETSEVILTLLIEHLDSSIEFADQAITWLKSFGGQSNPTLAAVNISNSEFAIAEQLAKIVMPCLEIVTSALPTGHISDLAVKLLCKLYRILGNLANYFITRSKYNKSCVTTSKMDRLVKIVGTQLTNNVYSLIFYLRKKYKDQEDEAKEVRSRKKKTLDPNIARARVLKETREIPNLIFQIENYEKNMAKVGKKLNQKFEFKLPTSRDFKIRLNDDHLAELKDDDEESSSESDEDDQDEDHSSSVLNRSDQNQSVNMSVRSEPPAKSAKLSAKIRKMKENQA